MTTVDLNSLSLTALAETGLARIRQAEKLSAESDQAAAQHEEQVKAAIVAGARSLFPTALGRHLHFDRLHRPNYEVHNLWNCVCLIEIPEWAPVEIYLEVSQPSSFRDFDFKDFIPEKLAVAPWAPHYATDWIHVLEYAIRYDDNVAEGYYLSTTTSRSYSDITLALADARKTGDQRLALHQEALQKIEERKEQASESDSDSHLMTISDLNAMYKYANNTEERYFEVIAGALLQIAARL